MNRITHGTLFYRFYDEKVRLGGFDYWVNGEADIEFTVTRDPSSGGDFADWNFPRMATLFVYNDEGDRVPFGPAEEKEAWDRIKTQLDGQDITDRCIEEALDFT